MIVSMTSACYNNHEMIPAPATLSEWALREAAASEGYPVTHAQFARYLAAGLLLTSDSSGRWPAEMLERLVRVRELSGAVPSLHARVIRLAGEGRYRVEAEALRRAMIKAARLIKHPARRLGQAERHATSLAQRSLRVAPRPGVKEWVPLLASLPADRFLELSDGWLAMSYRVVPSLYSKGPNPLADLSAEDLAVLLAVLDLSRRPADPVV